MVVTSKQHSYKLNLEISPKKVPAKYFCINKSLSNESGPPMVLLSNKPCVPPPKL